MLACVLLAGKTEDCHVSLTVIKQIDSSITKDIVYDMELQVLQALHFNIRVFHPRNILPTIIGDCRKWVEMQQRVSVSVNNDDVHIHKKIKIEAQSSECVSVSESKVVSDNSESFLDSTTLLASKVLQEGSSEMRKLWLSSSEHMIERLQCTHALFLFTPTEIALSALQMSLQDTPELKLYISTFESYLLYRYGSQYYQSLLLFSSRVKELYTFAMSIDVSS
jgi:hypothetical protein